MKIIFLILNAAAENSGSNIWVTIVAAIACLLLGYIVGSILRQKTNNTNNNVLKELELDLDRLSKENNVLKEDLNTNETIMNKAINDVETIIKNIPKFNDLEKIDGEEIIEFIKTSFIKSNLNVLCGIDANHFESLENKFKLSQKQAIISKEVRDNLKREYKKFITELGKYTPANLSVQDEEKIICLFFDMMVLYIDCINKDFDESQYNERREINDNNREFLNVMLMKGYVNRETVMSNARKVSVENGGSPKEIQLLNRILRKFIKEPIVLSGWKIEPKE